jgi:hypothetical protein
MRTTDNPDTISLDLAKTILRLWHGNLDISIYILSRALEVLCYQLVNEIKSQEPRQLALSAANYAKVCRELAVQSRDKQKLIEKVN